MARSQADWQAEESLELMPRLVRDKLDRIGIKLHLKEWLLLSIADRQRLRDLPCDSDEQISGYDAFLDRILLQATGRHPERLPDKNRR